MAKTINSRIPEGPVAEKWTNYKAHQRLVNPKNKLKLDVIVVGTGLAGASAAASLGEMGFRVLNFCTSTIAQPSSTRCRCRITTSCIMVSIITVVVRLSRLADMRNVTTESVHSIR